MKTLRWLLCVAISICASQRTAWTQVSVPHSFVAGQVASPDDVNSNFNTIASQALNRTGSGTITGDIAMAAGLHIGGVDIAGTLCATCSPTFAAVTVTGASGSAISVTGGVTIGGGLTAGSGVVGIVGTDGRIPALTSTYLASLNGSALTGLSASNVSSGTLAVARGGTGADFSATAQGNTLYFSAAGTVSALAPGTAGMFLRTGGGGANPTWSNDGSNLTGLNASQLAVGTVPDSRISGPYSGAVTFSNALNNFTGIYHSADGSTGETTTTCNATAGFLTFKNGLLISGC